MIIPCSKIVHVFRGCSDPFVVGRRQCSLILAHSISDRGIDVQTPLDGVHLRRHIRRLLQIRHSKGRSRGNAPAVERLQPGDATQHCGLSHAVAGNNTDLIALVDSKSGIGKEHPVAIALSQVFYL